MGFGDIVVAEEDMTALELVGALAAVAGTGLVLSLVLWLDYETTPAAVSFTPTPRSSQSEPAPQRRAA